MADNPLNSARALRTAQLIQTLGMGGAENIAVQIANAQAAAGHGSHLYVLSLPGPLSSRVHPDVHAHYLDYDQAAEGNLWRILLSLKRGYRLLSDRIRADGIDVVQTHLPRANFLGLLLALRRVCNVVATVHNNEEFHYGDTASPFRVRIRKEAYRQVLRRCQATVAVSEGVRQSLIHQLQLSPVQAECLVTVTNGVEIPQPLTGPEKQLVRQKYDVAPEVPLVVTAGRLTEQKNFASLIAAAAELRAQGIVCRIIIAGEGPLRQELERQIRESQVSDLVRLPGNVIEMRELMLSADLFVLPSLWEGLPLVLLEAMACGLPVVGSRIKGVTEVVVDGRSGSLVEPGDFQDLATAMIRLLHSSEERTRLTSEGLAVVRNRFSFTRVAQELETLYRRVISPIS